MLREGQHDLSPAGASHDRRGGPRGRRRDSRGRASRPRRRPAPAVRRKVKISYWTWADNPGHQKMVVDSVESFNKAQGFVTVELDATHAVHGGAQEGRRRLRRRARRPTWPAPCRRTSRTTSTTGILQPVDELFGKWPEKADYFPSVVEAMRSQVRPAGALHAERHPAVRPLLPSRLVPGGEDRSRPPTYAEFIDAAAEGSPGRRSASATRCEAATTSASRSIEPIWASAGVKIVDENGKVDFDSPDAIAVTEQWVGMYTKDKSAQATAVNDRYPQLFALMEGGKGGDVDLRYVHGHPAARRGAGRADPGGADATGQGPVGHAGEPEGLHDDDRVQGEGGGLGVHESTCRRASPRGSSPRARGLLPVRRSISADAGCSSRTASSSWRSPRPRPGGGRPSHTRTGPTTRTRSRRTGSRPCARRSR